MNEHEVVYKEESFEIMAACFAVYKSMGCGFLEAVYQECLEVELARRGMPFCSRYRLSLTYKGRSLEQFYEADIVCHGKIILELKAVDNLVGQHRAQVLNYLKATGMKLGILLNYGHHPLLEYERIVASDRWQAVEDE